jgi:hypothetical protein
MTRGERIEKFSSAIQQEIVSCPNEQSWEQGQVVCWIFGCPTDIGDLLMNHNVPEELQEDVVDRLRCPRCDSPFETWQEVGTKYRFERQHDATVEKALRKHEERLFEFNGFLHRFPLLGATHPFGKRILRELRKSPRITIHKPQWFRARVKKEHGFGPALPEKVADQRYNSSGQPRWYFADNAEAAVAEVTQGDTAWVQRFDVGHLDGLLDLRSWRADDERVLDEEGDYRPPHGLLVVTLIYGDLLTQRHHGDDEDRQWKPEYLVTRFVAEAAASCGFKGILCGCVRFPGENLIVFDPTWCPKELGEPVPLTLDEDVMRLRKNFYINQGEAFISPDEIDEITSPLP